MKIDFNKSKDGLVPAIIQDKKTYCVLMLGYMNKKAVDLTVSSGNVHFFSRSKISRLYHIEIHTSRNKFTIMIRSVPIYFIKTSNLFYIY